MCCMYVYEDSNFRVFRFPQVHIYADIWLEHQRLRIPSYVCEYEASTLNECVCFVLRNINYFNLNCVVYYFKISPLILPPTPKFVV